MSTLGLTEVQEAAVRASRSHNVALRIMEFAQREEGATVEEFQDHLQARIGTFNARLYELLRTQCLCVVGRRATRSGKLARVYKKTEGAQFAQYLELRSIVSNKKKDRDLLTDVERAILVHGMQLLKKWRSKSSERQRERAHS